MSYLRDRLIQAVVTLAAVFTLTFYLNDYMPGTAYPISFSEYMTQVFLYLDFGDSVSIAEGVPVSRLILERAPWTIFIVVIGLLFGLIVGIILGGLMAYYEGTRFDIGSTIIIILDNAIPYYAAAIVLLFFLAFQLGWFPTGGRINPDTTPGLNWPFISGILSHAILPAASFILTGFGGRALEIRANSIRLLGSEHMKVAKLRGLSPYRISTAYLARNAILPVYTRILITLGQFLGGTVVLEQIFQYPGMGMLMLEATNQEDWRVLLAVFVIISIIFVIGTVLADLTYSMIDPRADVKKSR